MIENTQPGVTLLTELLHQAETWSLPEVAAVLCATAYLVLAIRQNIWCWLFAAISTVIYVYLFAAAKLYMEAVLNAFYFALALYGWFVWSSGRTESSERPVVTWNYTTHIIAIIVIVSVSAVNGFLLSSYSEAAFPYIDSLTTWFAVWASFMVARKVLENWWYWLVIDLSSIFIYWSRDLQLTSLLFVLYVIMIPFGMLSWSKSMKLQST